MPRPSDSNGIYICSTSSSLTEASHTHRRVSRLFIYLYGRDPRVPTETALTKPRTPYQVDMDYYRVELTHGLLEAWRLAKKNIGVAQRKQKVQYDKRTRALDYHPCDRVMVYMPHEHSGKMRKMALRYYGPYRIVEVLSNGLSVRPVDSPQEQPRIG